jgi:hypothetical protein
MPQYCGFRSAVNPVSITLTFLNGNFYLSRPACLACLTCLQGGTVLAGTPKFRNAGPSTMSVGRDAAWSPHPETGFEFCMFR